MSARGGRARSMPVDVSLVLWGSWMGRTKMNVDATVARTTARRRGSGIPLAVAYISPAHRNGRSMSVVMMEAGLAIVESSRLKLMKFDRSARRSPLAGTSDSKG